MKTLYLDCSMGAAGDMLTAALLELLPDPDAFVAKLNALGLPGIRYVRESMSKCGITGTHMHVFIDGEEEITCDEGHHHEAESHEHSDELALAHHEYAHFHEHEEHHDHDHEHEHPDEEHHDHDHEHAHPDHEHAHEHDHADHVHDADHAHGQHGHVHRHLSDIEEIVRALPVPEAVKERIVSVYRRIAEAESKVHGRPVSEVHFHEVGALDAVADVTAVCLLMHEIAPDEVIVSPIHVGSGHVHCAHGILPVPAPATELILRGCPIYGGSIQGELCTPTGAALLTEFADRFGDLPLMQTEAAGYGMGRKDFPVANCLRAFLGTRAGLTDSILELSCNVDDMTGEAVGFAMERLLEAGARDVYTVPISMKKNRPGLLLRVMCTPQDRERMVSLLFRHTTTIGVRENAMTRYILDRQEEILTTPYGDVRKKVSSGYGAVRSKFEFEDLKKIALSEGISLSEAQALAGRAACGEK